jgi:hypothetical protein
MKLHIPHAKSDSHESPDRVYSLIHETWGHARYDMFDPCPLDDNPKFDGLAIPWHKINYVNPPYSALSEFVDKAIREAKEYGNESIMLLPAKTDQYWFHRLIDSKYEIKWIRKRLKFKNNKNHSTQTHFLVRII